MLLLILTYALTAETLEAVLSRAGVPTAAIPAPEVRQEITSYAVAPDDPFLLAYYDQDAAPVLNFPLRLIRYSRSRNSLVRAALHTLNAPFSDLGSITSDVCLGSALKITEQYGRVYIDTHINPSAGCLLVLSNDLSLEATLSGVSLAVLDENCIIVDENEIHFASVYPMHLKEVDLKRRSETQIYPAKDDVLRDRYSDLIRAHMPSSQWCAQTDSRCDPLSFDCELDGPIAVNSGLKSFGFIVRFDPGGFGSDAEHYVFPQHVAYVYRFSQGLWQHRETPAAEMRRNWHVATIDEAVASRSVALFGN